MNIAAIFQQKQMAGPIYEEVSTNTKLELRESVAYEPVQSIQFLSSLY